MGKTIKTVDDTASERLMISFTLKPEQLLALMGNHVLVRTLTPEANRL